MFSSRLDWTTKLNPIAEILSAKRAAGIEVLDVTESNPTHAGIDYPADLTAALADPSSIRYEPEPFGLPFARQAVASYYCGAVDPSRIVLTASTSEAYAYLFKLLCNPGDEVLTPRPSYPLFEYLARLESVCVRQYPLFYDHGWHVDRGALRDAITPRTRAIVTVHPNNPTGSFLKRDELAELTEIALEHDLAIISDEVFSDYAIGPDPARAGVVANETEALSFSLSGLSKIAGLPQMKLGWIVTGGRAELRDAALQRLELIADTYLSIGTPVQTAAGALIRARKSIQPQILERLRRNREQLPVYLDVEGGWYVTLRVPRVMSEEEWVTGLLRDYDVLVQPGFFYDFESEAYLVISVLTQPAVFDEALSRLAAMLADIGR